MTMKVKTIKAAGVFLGIAASLVAATALYSCVTGERLMKVTARVVDDGGTPVDAASISLVFGSYENVASGKTGRDGSFTAERLNHDLWCDVNVRKDGYYDATLHPSVLMEKTDGVRWLPWNPEVTLVLKRKINPAAMYACPQHSWILPGEAKRAEFDLAACDWLPPYGSGVVADLVLEVLETEYPVLAGDGSRGWKSKVRLSFSNPKDGLVVVPVDPTGERTSRLLLPQTAPENGYQPELVIASGLPDPVAAGGEKVSAGVMSDWGLIFRVRSKVDEKGEVVSSLYGKMNYPPLLLFDWEADEGKISWNLEYYLNPEPNSRALEFDTKKNLLKAEGRLDWVHVINP
ncbi:MAG: carboxypeptidase regulatory-like domain-containing protein [Lewinella sp.]|nr:carboxypeptidase regulatory-like domain-containing protein [Lewinella sp.]